MLEFVYVCLCEVVYVTCYSCYCDDVSLNLGFFFFKQKTAYEMRISDWSSDVCSSDLIDPAPQARLQPGDVLFVSARASTGPRIPLAARRLNPAELPIELELSDADAMAPQFRLSPAREVVVNARISHTGTAYPPPGDFEPRKPPPTPTPRDPSTPPPRPTP